MTNYPDGVDGSHAYFNEPDEPEAEVIDPQADAEAIKNLALAQALYKVIAAEVKTGNEFNLRGQVDRIMGERFAEAKKLGIALKSVDVEVDGEKVGTYSITTTEARPAQTRMELQVDSKAALFEWAVQYGYVDVDMKAVREHMDRTGEVPGGCELVPVEVPAQPGGEIARTTLRIDPRKVAEAMGGAELEDAVHALLEGGE